MAYDPEGEVGHYAELLVGVVKRHLVNDTVQLYAVKVTDDDGTTWEVSFQRVDAEMAWERSLSPEDKASLTVAKLSHLTDLIEMLGRQGTQTHHLLHDVASQVGVTHGGPPDRG